MSLFQLVGTVDQIVMLSQHYTLDNIKSRTVGDGQYGTARWATPKEISKTYQNIPFTPQAWRNGKQLLKDCDGAIDIACKPVNS